MPNNLHHVTVFVRNMERSLYLFRDILGFDLIWRKERVGGHKLANMVGIPDMECEMMFLQSRPGGTAVELIRLIRPIIDKTPIRFGGPGTMAMSVMVTDIDGLYRRLSGEDWIPFTPCMEFATPEGDSVRGFCFRTDEGMTLELIEAV